MGKGSKPPKRGKGGPSFYPPPPSMLDFSVPLDSLSSPSPSPPPPKQRAFPFSQFSHDLAGLDSDSEPSGLTEDEQDSVETKSGANIRKQPTRRRTRLAPADQILRWYNTSLNEEISNHSKPPGFPTHADHHHIVPAVYLYPLNDTFVLKRIALLKLTDTLVRQL